MKSKTLLVVSLVLTLFVFSLSAQDSDEPERGPDGGTTYKVGGIEILPLAGKPFSGRDHIEWTRSLEDGSSVITQLYAFLARDSRGRIYREHVSFVPANSKLKSKRRDIILLDPVAHTRTACIISTRHCNVTNYRAQTEFKLRPAGPFDHGRRTLVRETLGTDVVDDQNVVGTRETITINAGVVGNSQPLVSTREFWYSPDLQVNLAVTRKDPREGTQAIRVVDLSREEPDPVIFQVPNGFIVQDLRNEPENSATQ